MHSVTSGNVKAAKITVLAYLNLWVTNFLQYVNQGMCCKRSECDEEVSNLSWKIL